MKMKIPTNLSIIKVDIEGVIHNVTHPEHDHVNTVNHGQ